MILSTAASQWLRTGDSPPVRLSALGDQLRRHSSVSCPDLGVKTAWQEPTAFPNLNFSVLSLFNTVRTFKLFTVTARRRYSRTFVDFHMFALLYKGDTIQKH